ncbi:hypothetical protein DY000_02020322 [Brassica cretica]|uniref:Uncharacterized protein n=1 Tax=Brassica cretica TaxID=69181 RepID=A0ABQ7DYU7_BRACR|nr:hypothetical protein DY000_02020322 [Brassica cretica]
MARSGDGDLAMTESRSDDLQNLLHESDSQIDELAKQSLELHEPGHMTRSHLGDHDVLELHLISSRSGFKTDHFKLDEFSAYSLQSLASASQKLHDLKKNVKKRGHVSTRQVLAESIAPRRCHNALVYTTGGHVFGGSSRQASFHLVVYSASAAASARAQSRLISEFDLRRRYTRVLEDLGAIETRQASHALISCNEFASSLSEHAVFMSARCAIKYEKQTDNLGRACYDRGNVVRGSIRNAQFICIYSGYYQLLHQASFCVNQSLATLDACFFTPKISSFIKPSHALLTFKLVLQ